MSLIPKINLGAGIKRSKANMSFDSQTTANIGFVQPTMARMLIPNASINVKNRTLVRMSPLVNPTFGRLSQRDYFTFVRMSDVYKPWAEFLSGKPYSFGSTSYTPTALPKFEMAAIVSYLLSTNAYYSLSPAEDVGINIGWNESVSRAFMDTLIVGLKNGIQSFRFDQRYSPTFGSVEELDNPFGLNPSLIMQGRDDIEEYFNDENQPNSFGVRKSNGVEIVNNENADFTIFISGSHFASNLSWLYRYPGDDSDTSFDISTNGVYLHIRLKPFAKNMRKIFIGLGYGFNYWDNESYTPFKLIAFYKSWFDTFKPLRHLQFTSTYCYHLIKQLEDVITVQNLNSALIQWLSNELIDSFYYYTAPDYFSASLYNLGDNTLASALNNSVVSPIVGNITDYRNLQVDTSLVENAKVPTTDDLNVLSVFTTGIASTQSGFVDANRPRNTDPSNPLNSKSKLDNYFNLNSIAIPTLLKLMRFTNKNNVIGRSIREYAKVHYGIDDIESDNMSVTKINSSRIDINFDDVINTAASKDAFLGEYAGKGLGYKESDNTYFTAKDFGFFFCMSVIVPESGYYQGTLKENKITDKFEFFTEEFDALGYEVISRGEIKSDFNKETSSFNPSVDFNTEKGFGFIPRYTHFKVGRNIVNGDLTLGSTKNGLQGYYLDKEFPSYKVESKNRNQLEIEKPDYLPLVVNDNIRKIDPSDNVGNYNRIFQYTDIDLDHFIIQKVFDVEVTAPWKSLSDSFDTIQQDENVISRNHQ